VSNKLSQAVNKNCYCLLIGIKQQCGEEEEEEDLALKKGRQNFVGA